ncbi:hypothetical protein AgCh_005434 [Apium graveolens]
MSSLPWCIWGDFNDLLYASDKKGIIPHPQVLLDGFGKAIEDCNLSELHMCGGKYTWEKSRGTNNWVREKLDRCFATLSWLNKFPLNNLKQLHTSISDHEPLLVELFKADIAKKMFRFKFENIWLKDSNFVKEGRSFFHKFREEVKDHKANMDRLVDCYDDLSVKKYLEEKENLNILLLHEETYWKQRSKVFWLQEGDDNTRGEVNNTVVILGVVGHRTVSEEHNKRLTEEFSFEEFTVAVKQMHPDKASGPDGLSNDLNDASSAGETRGWKISPTTPIMSHLLFADDSFLFFQASTEEATNIKRLLGKYEECSGRNEAVSSLLIHNERRWNTRLVIEHFIHEDVEVILSINVPQRDVPDRVDWTGSKDGVCNTPRSGVEDPGRHGLSFHNITSLN